MWKSARYFPYNEHDRAANYIVSRIVEWDLIREKNLKEGALAKNNNS
jgi:hypothetical protein